MRRIFSTSRVVGYVCCVPWGIAVISLALPHSLVGGIALWVTGIVLINASFAHFDK